VRTFPSGSDRRNPPINGVKVALAHAVLPPVVTPWVAFTVANAGNGAMEVIPGSHKLDQIPHRDTFAKHNLLTRGQEIAVEVDQSKAVRLDLEPGEISLHHVRLVHGSPPNTSDDRRSPIPVAPD
jgi:non-heme Fe2+,alpha-ketoglutarate-dependent halogenase